MEFPMSLSDLNLWLALMSILLLITSELISSYKTKYKFFIDRENLRKSSTLVGLCFIFSAIFRVFEIILQN